MSSVGNYMNKMNIEIYKNDKRRDFEGERTKGKRLTEERGKRKEKKQRIEKRGSHGA